MLAAAVKRVFGKVLTNRGGVFMRKKKQGWAV